MTRTLVVTGAAGFVGQSVVREAMARGLAVVAVSRRRPPQPTGALTVVGYADIPCPADACLVHLAEERDASRAEAEGESFLASTCDRLRGVLARPFARVVYASSAVVYGDRRAGLRRPTDAPEPAGVYARTKLACEALVVASPAGACARLANLYGPGGMSPGSVLAEIMAQIPGTAPIRLRDATPVRDFLHVPDAARCLVDLAVADVAGVLNVGTGRGVSTGALARMASDAAGQPERPIEACGPALGRASVLVLDASDTTTAVGWRARVPLEEGLVALVPAASRKATA